MKKIILSILVCSLLFSCEDMETVVTIDIPPHESVLVLNSIFDTDTEIRVLVSHSVGAFEQNTPSCITDAEVLLFENNQVPHSQIFIDRFNSGGLPIALDYSLLLLNNQHKTNLNQKSEIKRYYFEHPDLSFIFPLPGPKNTISEYLSPWFEFLNSKKYHPVEDWLNHIESGNKQGIISVETIKEQLYLKKVTHF